MGRICIFGGSITHGRVDQEMNGWVERFKSWYEGRDNVGNAVFNLGIPGDTTEDLLARLDSESQTRLGQDYKDVNHIIISTGTNDTKSFSSGGDTYKTVDEFKDNLSKLIDLAKKHANRIIFLAVTPINETKMPLIRSGKEIFFCNKHIDRFNKASKEVCEEKGAEYIHPTDFPYEFFSDDGLHPNEKGHEFIFQLVKRSFE